MVAPSVTFDGTRLSNAATDTDGGSWDKWDTSQNPSQEPDILYEGTGELSVKVGSTSAAGIEFFSFTGGTVDFATTPKVWLAKTNVTNYAALDAKGATGHILYIGSGTTTNRMLYYTHGNDNYPLKGGWIFNLIDPNLTYEDTEEGTLDQTAVDYFAVSAEFSAASKVENVIISAIDYFDVGTGLTLIGGDGASADATFEDFRVFEEDTATNRHGIVSSVEGILFALGMLTVGTATETDFTDATGGTLVFSDGRFGAGTVGLTVDIQHATSVFSCTGWSFGSRGNETTADSRPDYIITGTGASASATFTTCTFRNYCSIVGVVKAALVNCTIVDGGLVDCGTGMTLNGCTFSECSLDGTSTDLSHIEWDVNLDPSGDLDDITITKGTNPHHAIEFGTTAPLTMNLSGWTTSGFHASNGNFDSTFYFADRGSDVTWTVNVSGGSGNFSYKKARAGDTVVVNVAVAVTFDKMKDNTEVRVFKTSDDSVVDGIENATAGSVDDRSFTWSAAAATDVYYRIINKTHEFIEVRGYVVPANNTTVDIAQRPDPDYSNP